MAYRDKSGRVQIIICYGTFQQWNEAVYSALYKELLLSDTLDLSSTDFRGW